MKSNFIKEKYTMRKYEIDVIGNSNYDYEYIADMLKLFTKNKDKRTLKNILNYANITQEQFNKILNKEVNITLTQLIDIAEYCNTNLENFVNYNHNPQKKSLL